MMHPTPPAPARRPYLVAEPDNAAGGEGEEKEREKRKTINIKCKKKRGSAALFPLVRLKAPLQRGEGSKLLISASEKARV